LVRLYRFGSNQLRPAPEEFNGIGGVRAAGRWHISGKLVVYASTCEPLALLEKLVHRDRSAPVLAYPLYLAEVPDDLIEDLPARSLPHDWRSIYPPRSTQELGNAWLASSSAAGLLVPSVLVSGIDPEIENCILNPAHQQYHLVEFSGPIPIAVDPRFLSL
jgi:RES domain-containing protein